MASKTYTFAGITNPSATHIAWAGFHQEDPPSGGALVQMLEASSPDYAALAVSDDSRASCEGMLAVFPPSHALWEFDWLITVPRADVTRIDVSCKGLGFADSEDGWRLHVRKNTGGGAPVWELLDTEPTSGEATLTGAVTADILDYITDDGHIYVLAEQVGTYVDYVPSTIQVDMTSCQLTYTVGLSVSLHDNISTAESLGRAIPISRSLSDNVVIAEWLKANLPLMASLSDTIGITEWLQANLSSVSTFVQVQVVG